MDENRLLEPSFCRRHRGDRAGKGVARIEADALVLFAAHHRQGAGPAVGERCGALGGGGVKGQQAPSRQQRHGMEDAGEPQVERQGGTVLVSR